MSASRSDSHRKRRKDKRDGRAAYERAFHLAHQDLRKHKLEILALLQQGARARYGPAEYALATWYLFGRVVKKDYARGAALLRRAAAAGVPDAAYDLGVSYERGRGVAMDKRAAFRMYKRAAALGDHQSEYELARCYYWGIGTSRDSRKESYWFKRALRHKVKDALNDTAYPRAPKSRSL